jgi:predicted anti-sigma-YlaC factor YlaD
MTLNNSRSAPLSCAEFQEQLPDLFAAGGKASIDDPQIAEHLKSCENCSALVRDLQYIADQAKQLLQPTHEPSDDVWKKIQEGLAADPSYATGPGKS